MLTQRFAALHLFLSLHCAGRKALVGFFMLPPEAANGTIVLPVRLWLSRKALIAVGATYHQIGKRTKLCHSPACCPALRQFPARKRGRSSPASCGTFCPSLPFGKAAPQDLFQLTAFCLLHWLTPLAVPVFTRDVHPPDEKISCRELRRASASHRVQC